ncbi:MAG: hypothetical protein M3O30_03340 [Planctomycetota bacterium]|nr:hypothetical protein [Planctomycetota bacterium]
MSEVIPDATVRTVPALVTTDIPCRKCSCNLRGLMTDARCPQCGAPIAASVSCDLLRYCDPGWVTLLARGTKLIIAGVAVIFLSVIAGIALGISLRTKMAIYGSLAGLTGNLLMVAGSWLVTTPDPSGVGEDQYGTARKVIRITLLIGIVNAVVHLAAKLSTLPPEITHLLAVIGGLAGIIGVVGLFAELQYYEKLAERIPDPALSSRAKYLKKYFPAFHGLTIVSGLLIVLFARKGAAPGGAFMGLGCFFGIMGVAALIYAIMYLLMIERFSKRFKEQAILAREIWATHTQPPAR